MMRALLNPRAVSIAAAQLAGQIVNGEHDGPQDGVRLAELVRDLHDWRTNDLAPLLDAVTAAHVDAERALAGDSNDAEHDALYTLAGAVRDLREKLTS
jgi:hypothetical protein